MFSISFIFKPGQYDEQFHRLDALVERAARRTPGFLGSESWVSSDGVMHNAVYYWSDLAHLREFSGDPDHQLAKREYARWYDGYQVVVAEIAATYGDGRLDHVTRTGPTAD